MNLDLASLPLLAPGVTATQTGLLFPPNLPYGQWLGIGPHIAQLLGATRWWAGDWMAYGLKTYGNKVKGVLEFKQCEQQLTMDAAWVSQAVPQDARKPELPWVAHREVAELENQAQKDWLAKMEVEGLAVVELRRAIRQSGATNPVKGNSYVWDSQTKKLREVIRWLKARPPEFWNNERMAEWAEEIKPIVEFYEGLET